MSLAETGIPPGLFKTEIVMWCGLADRLHAVSRADVAGRLPAAGEDGDGLWFLHWEDDYQDPYPSRDAAWADWHAAAAARRRPAPAPAGT
jgi:hypothetical protein